MAGWQVVRLSAPRARFSSALALHPNGGAIGPPSKHIPPPPAPPPAALLAACAGAVVLLAPMINAKSYVQLEDERKAAAAKLA